jgi:hypothetical protein
MKILTLLLCVVLFPLVAGSWEPDLGTLPSPAGQSPRYQIILGSIIDKDGNPVPQTIRLDTWTGETWTLVNAGLQTWGNVPESDSPFLVQLRKDQAKDK